MKRILVTGANGQLGKCIQKASKNHSDLEFDFRTSRELNITKANDVNSVIEGVDFDYCINCAAYTDVEQAEKTPKRAFEVNAEGVKNLATSCSESKVILIHISTDYVFDGEKEKPYTVNDNPNPINEYGKSKLKGEEYIQEILKEYFIVRTSWLYSKEYGDNFYKTILRKAKKRGTLKITDVQVGCPTDTINLVDFILNELIIKHKGYGLYHYTDAVPMTWYDFAKKIIEDNNLNTTSSIMRDNSYRSFAMRPKNSRLKNNN